MPLDDDVRELVQQAHVATVGPDVMSQDWWSTFAVGPRNRPQPADRDVALGAVHRGLKLTPNRPLEGGDQ